MRITNASIFRYGPLEEKNISFSSGLNIIFGPNGAGKTLLTRAIKKLLVGRTRGRETLPFPQGSIKVFHDDESFEFNGDDSLQQAFNLCEADLENIFFIIDGLNHIENEQNFYEDIIPRLIGLDLSKIEEVKTNLLDLGRMASSGRLSNNSKYDKPVKQLKDAEKLIESIDSFIANTAVLEGSEVLVEISTLKQEKVHLEKEIQCLKEVKRFQDLKEFEKSLESAKALFSEKNSLDIPEVEEIKSLVEEFNIKGVDIPSEERKVKNYQLFSFLATLISLSCVIGIIFNPDLVILGFGAIIGALGIFLILSFIIQIRNRVASTYKLENQIRSLVKSLNWSVTSISDVHAYVSKHEARIKRIDEDYQQLIGILKNISKVSVTPRTLSEFGGFESYYSREIKLVNHYPEITFTQTALNKSEERCQNIVKQVEMLQDKKVEFQTALNTIIGECRTADFSFDAVLGRTPSWESQNIESLRVFKNLLLDLMNTITMEQRVCEVGYEIYDRILNQETQKLSEFFSDETKVSDFISEISDGYFTHVNYLANAGEFTIVRRNNEIQNVGFLSQGELSQFYLTIRMALAMRCLDGKAGFLVMEDPFLTSDQERLEGQLRILYNFINQGWQIIILTMQDQLKNKLVEMNGTIVQELPRL